MNLFTRACMTAIALAAMTLPLFQAAPSEARDNNRHRHHHRGSNSEFFGGAMRDDRHFNSRHMARRDRRFDRGFGSIDRGFGSVDRGFRSVDRGVVTMDRGFGSVGRRWQDRGWGRFGGSQLDRPAPYYTGSARPYYAGQYRLYNNSDVAGNFYGGAIAAYQDPGNGNYFYTNGYGYGGMGDGGGYVTSGSSNRGKVIVVTPETETASCAWEAGVCVIRP